jgi:hypothetical protein
LTFDMDVVLDGAVDAGGHAGDKVQVGAARGGRGS